MRIVNSDNLPAAAGLSVIGKENWILDGGLGRDVDFMRHLAPADNREGRSRVRHFSARAESHPEETKVP
jgi:hypothetical protein